MSKPLIQIHSIISDISRDWVNKYWFHKKTEGTYEIITFAYNESTLEPCVVYQSTSGMRHTFIRPAKEFFDGRFVKLNIPRSQ